MLLNTAAITIAMGFVKAITGTRRGQCVRCHLGMERLLYDADIPVLGRTLRDRYSHRLEHIGAAS